jgi:thiol:disulfide interchange protein DsbC
VASSIRKALNKEKQMQTLGMKFKLITCAVLTFFACQSWAEAKDTIRESLSKQFPTIKIDEITESPITDLYQVSAGPNIIYVTKDGRYVLSGDIIDLKDKQTNITENVRKTARLKGLNEVKPENAIVYAPKDPKYTVTVFTDVDCGYCRKFHSDIKKLNELGIAVRYLAFPRSGPNSPTFDKMVKIWCAKDKNQALNAAKHDQEVDGKVCDNNPIMSQLEYGMQIGVSGTPTLVFEDGTMIPGYLPPDKLLELAKQLKK